MKLNIGCGKEKIKGFKTLDINKKYNPDFVVDITKTIPIKNNRVKYIRCFHILEHILPNKLDNVINSFWRILKHNGILHLKVPHFTTPPYEKHFFHARYLFLRDYYDKTKSFILLERRLIFKGKHKIFENLINKFPVIYENSFLRSFIFANTLELIIKANKKVKFINKSGSH